MEQVRIEYNRTDKRYNLAFQMYAHNPNTTEIALTTNMFKSLIKLMKQEGKVQKILGRMEDKDDNDKAAT